MVDVELLKTALARLLRDEYHIPSYVDDDTLITIYAQSNDFTEFRRKIVEEIRRKLEEERRTRGVRE